jgi:hypothetical protein
MQPTLRAGDRLLVDRSRAVAVGDLVVVRLARTAGSAERVVAVKRAAYRVPEGWWLERDNPRAGIDSWHVGAVPDADVLGVVLLRWWPRPSGLARGSRPRPGWRERRRGPGAARRPPDGAAGRGAGGGAS